MWTFILTPTGILPNREYLSRLHTPHSNVYAHRLDLHRFHYFFTHCLRFSNLSYKIQFRDRSICNCCQIFLLLIEWFVVLVSISINLWFTCQICHQIQFFFLTACCINHCSNHCQISSLPQGCNFNTTLIKHFTSMKLKEITVVSSEKKRQD